MAKPSMFESMTDRQISDCVEATISSEKSKIFAGKALARWFELDFSIKIFGVEIVHWHFPPENKNAVVDNEKNS